MKLKTILLLLFVTLTSNLAFAGEFAFPTKERIPILSLRANDTNAYDNVLPESGARIIALKDARHIDMCDRGPEDVKQEITELTSKFIDEEKPMYQAVFAYPILPGKIQEQRQRYHDRKEKKIDAQYQKELLAYRQEMGWTEIHVWLQQLPKEDLHVVLLRSEQPLDPELILTRFQSCIEGGNAIAKDIHTAYLETQGMDFCDRASYATLDPLPEFQVDFTEEELTGKTIKEYAFAYPLLPGQASRVVEYNQENLNDPDRLAYFKAMRKKLGITETHGWIQRGFGREMLVIQQKVIDPLSKACDGWHDAVENETIMKKHAELYLQATGLTSKELIPNLEAQ